jgi:RNA polymerase sigma factor (TIGR02999 family)
LERKLRRGRKKQFELQAHKKSQKQRRLCYGYCTEKVSQAVSISPIDMQEMQVSQPITLALQDLARGDKTALDRLLPYVYAELRKLAGHYLRREREGHTLQPTALVHEAYFRLVDPSQPDFQGRSHFLGVAAHVMRQILTDHARTRNASKRGSGQVVFSLDESMDTPVAGDATVVRVDDALRALEVHDPLKGQLVEMRFFGGMTAEESANVLGLALPKVRSELRIAQAWLRRELDNCAVGHK